MIGHFKEGISILEVIAGVVILAVVTAASVATLSPLNAEDEDQIAVQEKEIASLNAMAQTYFLEESRFPRNVHDLVTAGYLSSQTPEAQQRISDFRRNYSYDPISGTFAKR